MRVSIVLAVFIIGQLSATCYAQLSTITLSITDTRIHPGDDVTLVCRVTDPRYATVTFVKEVHAGDGTILKELISNNDILMEPYKSSKRFAASMDLLDNVGMCKLTISGAIAEDGGFYVCIAAKWNLTAQVLLEVFKNTTGIELINSTASSMTFIEGQSKSLTFQVPHTCPVPMTWLSIGGRNISGCLSRQNFTNVLCSGSIGSKTCPLSMDYTVVATCNDLKLNRTHDSQKLVFRAVYNAALESPVYENDVTVLFEPAVHCNDLAVRIENNTRATLTCHVMSNPPPHYFEWVFTVNGTTLRMTNDEVHPEYYVGKKTFLHDTTITLTIQNIEQKHFTSYTLNVQQQLKNVTAVLKVTEETLRPSSPRPPPSAAAQPSHVMFIYQSLFVIVLLCFR